MRVSLCSPGFSFNVPRACNCSTAFKYTNLFPKTETDIKVPCLSVGEKEQMAKEAAAEGEPTDGCCCVCFSEIKENAPGIFENFLHPPL